MRILDDLVIIPEIKGNENALIICGIFKKNALEQGCDKTQVDAVLAEARSSTYSHLVQVITDNTITTCDH
jgi:hypothetical protein